MRNTIRAKLDELLNWYDAYQTKPVTVIQVCATANTIRKFAKKKRGTASYVYRNREIVPTRPVRTLTQIEADKRASQ